MNITIYDRRGPPSPTDERKRFENETNDRDVVGYKSPKTLCLGVSFYGTYQ